MNRRLVADFVLFAHSDLAMVKKLAEKEPRLIEAVMDWGGGDWESGLGGASHMGRRDIVEYLLERGARIDLFCAAMMGQLDAVRAFLTLQPKLIDARGPHGFSLHFHAQVGGERAEKVLDYLQSVKKLELKPVPFLKKAPKKPG
ncbi:MAG: ankyrin repeat domain-containing protein [Gemmataceae bacterium]